MLSFFYVYLLQPVWQNQLKKGLNPEINIMWLKFGTRVPYDVNIHQKKPPIDWKIIFPFLGHFVPTPGKSIRGLKKLLFQCHLYGSYYIPIDNSQKTIQRTFKRIQSISSSISRYKTSKLTILGTFDNFLHFELKYLAIEEEIDYTHLKVLYIVFRELSIGI